MLLGDLFELQAVAPDYVRAELRSSAGCQAAVGLCRQQAAEVRQLLDALPGGIANWTPTRGSSTA
jgi:hypothetical protein